MKKNVSYCQQLTIDSLSIKMPTLVKYEIYSVFKGTKLDFSIPKKVWLNKKFGQ